MPRGVMVVNIYKKDPKFLYLLVFDPFSLSLANLCLSPHLEIRQAAEELGNGEEVVGAGDEGVGVVGRRRGLGSAVGRGGREGG